MIIISIIIIIIGLSAPSFKEEFTPIAISRLSTILMIYSGALSFNALHIQSIGSGIGIYSGFFQITPITQHLDTFILIIGGLLLIPRPTLLKDKISLIREYLTDKYSTELGKYSLLILFSILGSLLLISSSDLLSMYLSIELQSFGVYILSTLFKDSKSATSAGLKYFLLGGFSSCLILLGSGIVFTYTGLTNFDKLYSIVSTISQSNIITPAAFSDTGYYLGFVLILTGLLFKIAAAPLHNWAPDVYDESPTIITTWLTIMPKISILIFTLDLILGLNNNNLSPALTSTLNTQPAPSAAEGVNNLQIIKNLLIISSLLSLILGTVVGLAQSKIKRLLAYSTISHVGFILLALSINSQHSIESFLFYIIQYSITNLNIFFIILALGYLIKKTYFKITKNKDIDLSNKFVLAKILEYKNKTLDLNFISEFTAQFLHNPLLSLALSICLFSMAGIPPFIGFFSKQMVLYSAIQSGYYLISVIAILVSVISASYYLYVIRTLFTIDGGNNETDSINNDFTITHTYTQYVLQINRMVSVLKKLEYYIINNYLKSSHSYIIASVSLVIFLFLFNPSLILNSSQLLSLNIFNC